MGGRDIELIIISVMSFFMCRGALKKKEQKDR